MLRNKKTVYLLVIILLINKNAKLYYCKYLLVTPRNSVNYRRGRAFVA